MLSIYFTAGFPNLEDTNIILEELVQSGADMIEIGIPFSDPLADGPVIQHSNEVALKNGMTLKLLFEQLEKSKVKSQKSKVPMILMGYLNPVLQFGVENFCKRASEVGISGVILPDLPMDEYLSDYKPIFQKYNLSTIFLITPHTSEKRIRMIDDNSDGFIYMVSSSSTTGCPSPRCSDWGKPTLPDGANTRHGARRQGKGAETLKYFSRIKNMNLKNPLMIGFGISDRQSFSTACQYAHGAIIGSAFIKHLENGGEAGKFVSQIR
ncbi:MAG: tryptophan synthase subunit alpha [Bacteroidetes bacterium]|nr:tryptophan synthase subunit alpha [Bacteroidota bacterium]